MKMHIFKHLIFGLAHVSFGMAVAAGFSAAVMVAWNMVVPDVFGLTAISFWQALGLLLLARLLFGSWHGMRFHAHRNPVRDKWAKMSHSERAEFIRKMYSVHKSHGFSQAHGFFHHHLSDEEKAEAGDAPQDEK
ncbi:MAG: hypothetical protein LBO71_07340 [Prevotellaceae bacterium]|jgi:hypothetical protein|nr:hypothetical protein [Prevotellaceae bacterium]